MKAQIRIAVGLLMIVASCKKEDHPSDNTAGPVADNYSSMADFYAMNGVSLQHYTVDAASGGNFTTPNGTVITVPANAFSTLAGGNVAGNVTIEFKDIYKKSDMLLSDKPTITALGGLLKSAGEFFIKAVQDNEPLRLGAGKKIDVVQPAIGGVANDTAMAPFVANPDTMAFGNFAWQPAVVFDSVNLNATSYVFSLYAFTSPEDTGTWCNSDNSSYFNAFSQTVFTLHATYDPDTFYTDVFLVFANENSMVHVYRNSGTPDFSYFYAPQGLSCTVVAVAVKEGKLYSSFTPITIGSNQTVDFSVSVTTTDAFKAALSSLN